MELSWLLEQTATFALVLARVGGLMATALPFGSPLMPPLVRALFSLVVSLVLVPTVPLWQGDEGWPFAGAVLAEVAAGLAIGLVSQFLFMAVQGAGALIDLDMGFGMVQLFDPQYGSPAPLMGSFLHLVSLGLYLGFDGHHHLLRALSESFVHIPLGGGGWDGGALVTAVEQLGWVFATALRIAFPVLALLFLTNVAFALVARTMPQLHVLVVGLPARIAVGFAGLLVVLVPLARLMEEEWVRTITGVMGFIRGLTP